MPTITKAPMATPMATKVVVLLMLRVTLIGATDGLNHDQRLMLPRTRWQELRVVADAKLSAYPLAGPGLQPGDDALLGSAGWQCRANDQQVVPLGLFKSRPHGGWRPEGSNCWSHPRWGYSPRRWARRAFDGEYPA